MSAQEKAPARAEHTEPGSNQRHFQDATNTAQGKPIDLTSLGAEAQTPVITIDGKRAVQLPGNDRTIGEFADELGRLLRNESIFRRGRAACVPDEEGKGLSFLSPESFRSWIETYVTPVAVSYGSTLPEKKKSPSADNARAVLESPQFLKHLRPIRTLSPVRMPTIRPTGELDILPSGYDALTSIFTDPHGLVWREDFNFEQAIEVLDELLIDFPFVDERSKSVALAAMLTVFGRHLLDSGTLIPCFFFDANSEGSGKSTLASLAALPHGTPRPQSLPGIEAEVEKRLVTLVRSGRRVEILDNAKGHIDSPSLEGYLSATEWGGRILGRSEEISGEAGAVILLTGNGCTFTPDLRRRSLSCHLFVKELRAEDRTFQKPLDVPAMMKLRGPIMSCLWALIRGWDQAGRPKGTGCNASFQTWADVIGGILEHAGYSSPATPSDIGVGGDTDTRDMQRLGENLEPSKLYQFAEIVSTCHKIGVFENVVGFSGDQIDRTAKSRFGSILKRFEGKMLLPRLYWRISGSGHSRRFNLSENH